MYNISKFKGHETFIRQARELAKVLQDRGRISGSPKFSFRRLWNYGESGDGATRTYQQLREGHLPNTIFPGEIKGIVADILP